MVVSIMYLLIMLPGVSKGQCESEVVQKYLKKLPCASIGNTLQKYRMTAVYINRDLYGNFTGKTKVTGDYTRGLAEGTVTWNNIFISNSGNFEESFPAGTRQEYMENVHYVPSPAMLDAGAFKDFPAEPQTVFAKNLVWDMMAIEEFAWNHIDSLTLNQAYSIPDPGGQFNMAGIGNYSQPEIQLCWTGISAMDGELCAVIEFRALDNKIELTLDALKSRGTEQYWGTIWISLDTRLIRYATMYSGTIQELEIQGMKDKILAKTIRELHVDIIQ